MNKIILFLKKIIIIYITIISFPLIALKNDIQQQLNIFSNKQFIDFKKNITMFSNNVVIKQGTINIKADKVIITHQKNNNNKITIEAFGAPITFHQLQDNGNIIKGNSKQARYEVDKKLIILKGNAHLEQLDNNISSDIITYIISKQKIEAFSNKGNHVTTILYPKQLKNNF
ncbi:lipopolysaccharide transport periplasmic protein LptA [Candidatus Providencia siddallii]|uniref:Lipopolysaccharide export system protein LptA n=1 Tax=Candidatus Providencia siddallii TaxID=1715285 RepID=A0ABM9NPD7_9GAMM